MYMYFSTRILYDYDDWSSYPNGLAVALVLNELHVKFQACGIKSSCGVCDTATPTGWQGLYKVFSW